MYPRSVVTLYSLLLFLKGGETVDDVVVSDRKSIAFLVLAPYGVGAGETAQQPNWKGGPAVIPAARMAVDRINNRTDILPGYEVHLVEGNSGCQNEARSVYSSMTNVFSQKSSTAPNVVGIIGPACSESAILLGPLGARDRISLVQVSPSATSPQLTDTKKYRNTFRLISTSLHHVAAVAELMARNSWTKVAVLYDHTRLYFRVTAEKFIADYSSVIGFRSEISETIYPLGNIEARFKVIVVLSWYGFAREMLCMAYHYRPQLIFPIYQWVFVDSSKAAFITDVQFVYSGQSYVCTPDMMKRALEGSIFTAYRLLDENKTSEATDVDLTLGQYQELYPAYIQTHVRELNRTGRDTEYSENAEEYGTPYYDATWALTLALNATINELSSSSLLHYYQNGQPQITQIIKNHLSELKFHGLMGYIEFQNDTNDASTPLNIHQCIDGNSVLIGWYNGTNVEITHHEEPKFVVELFIRKVISVHPAATTVAAFFLAILTLYTCGLHIVFVIFHNHKSIKAASFSLSHFMFSGCYLILLRVLLTVAINSYGWEIYNADDDHTRKIIEGLACNVNEWLNSLGISLVMSTLCGKSWRIYRIFSHFVTRPFLISDLTLVTFTIIVVGVNVIILVMWTSVDPLLAVFEQEGIEYDGESEPILLERAYCRCSYFSVWISLTYVVILSLILCLVILSFLNRRVNRSLFQRARSVNVMVYLISLSCFLGIVLAVVFEPLNIHYTYVSWQFSLLSIVSLIDIFMFSPTAFRTLRTYHS